MLLTHPQILSQIVGQNSENGFSSPLYYMVTHLPAWQVQVKCTASHLLPKVLLLKVIVLRQLIVLWLFWQWWLGEGFLLRVPTWKFPQHSTQKISTRKPTLTHSCTLFCDSLAKSWLGLILAYLIICMQHLRERLLVFPKVAKTNSKFCSSLVFKVHNFGGCDLEQLSTLVELWLIRRPNLRSTQSQS